MYPIAYGLDKDGDFFRHSSNGKRFDLFMEEFDRDSLGNKGIVVFCAGIDELGVAREIRRPLLEAEIQKGEKIVSFNEIHAAVNQVCLRNRLNISSDARQRTMVIMASKNDLGLGLGARQ